MPASTQQWLVCLWAFAAVFGLLALPFIGKMMEVARCRQSHWPGRSAR